MASITPEEQQNSRDLRLQKMKETSQDSQNAEKSPLASGEKGPYELAQEKQSAPQEQEASSVPSEKKAQRQLGQDRLQSRKETNDSKNKESQSSPVNTGQRGVSEKLSAAGGVTSVKGSWQRLKNIRLRTKNKKSRLKEKAGKDDESKAKAEKLANAAVKKAWMAGHEIVEEALIANLYLLPILGPIYILLLIARPFVAMLGMLHIKIKGVKVKLVPGYSINSFFLRAKGATIIALITALEWFVIYLMIMIFTQPYTVIWEGLKMLWPSS